jgi:uncharacterized protein
MPMPIIFLSLGLAFLLVLVAALLLSNRLTRRYRLVATRCPAEFGLAFEDVAFATLDGLTLRGWFIPRAGSHRAVVLLHGHAGSMDPDIQYVPALHAAGLNVLMFDFRAHGRSDGQVCTLGCLERRDVLAAVQLLRSRGLRRIAVLGFSLGGRVAMLTAPVCPEIDVVIDDGGPVRLSSALRAWACENRVPGWLASPLAWLALAATSLRVGSNLFRCEPVNWASGISPRPFMIIHGEEDQYCPDLDDLLRACPPPTELWRLPGVGHVQASVVFPDEYRRRVVAFLQEYL